MLPSYIGSLISILLRISSPRHCLEIGAFTGQTTAVIADTLSEGASLVSLEEDHATFSVLQENLRACGLGSKVQAICSEGFKWLREYDRKFDFILLDARKEFYFNSYDLLVSRLLPGAVLIVDNVLCHGHILSPNRDYVLSMSEFNRILAEDRRMSVAMLPIRDGITIAYKK